MRRIVTSLLALTLALIAAACDSSTTIRSPSGTLVHWQQNQPGNLERRIDLIVPPAIASDGFFMTGLDRGIQALNRSPYVQLEIDVAPVPTTCPDRHCMTVDRKPTNAASAAVGWGPDGHIYGLGARLTFDSAPWNVDVLANAACHEAAHAVGLDHGQDHNRDGNPDTAGPCQGGIPTQTDLDNVRVTTGHTDAQIYGITILEAQIADVDRAPPQTEPFKLRTIHRHTRAELEAMTP